MLRFVGKFRVLLESPPVARMFKDVYGSGWERYTADDWEKVYREHEATVDYFFADEPHRLLKLDICEGGESCWSPLCDFLQEPPPVVGTAFPHADVFSLSAGAQVGWQLTRLRKRFGWRLLVTALVIVALRPAVADHGQCTRACRVANADSGAPPVLGATGDWFATSVGGRRALLAPDTCYCHQTRGSKASLPPLPHPVIPRLHTPLDTPHQWHFNTRAVCGADNVEYPSVAAARNAGVDVANCGQCSRCSALVDVDAMHARSTSLTKRASFAGIV